MRLPHDLRVAHTARRHREKLSTQMGFQRFPRGPTAIFLLLAALELFGRFIEFFPVIPEARYKLTGLFGAQTVLARKIVDFVFLVSCDASPVGFADMAFIVGHPRISSIAVDNGSKRG